ncbi:MAG TPA: nuclear transport factor 2 family protein [Usitatibacter sp.]|nr:nuclear transport factor 2 family protein [Usitatibacter sp.]
MKNLAALLAALAVTACAHAPPSREAAESLAAAETAFAAHSVREDMRAAFMAHFAADGVLVRDGWVVARDWLAPRAAPAIVLDWRPAYVEVAASGEMGLSTGPWKITAPGASAPSSFGQFVSIWKREPGQPWRVAIDLGIGHATPALADAPLELHLPVASRAGGSLHEAEAAFARDSASRGEREAYRAHGAASLRRYREGIVPEASHAAALASPSMSDLRIAWTAERIEAARSDDFGYAMGYYADAAAPATVRGHYLRVWRREEGGWKVVMDVVNARALR